MTQTVNLCFAVCDSPDVHAEMWNGFQIAAVWKCGKVKGGRELEHWEDVCVPGKL